MEDVSLLIFGANGAQPHASSELIFECNQFISNDVCPSDQSWSRARLACRDVWHASQTRFACEPFLAGLAYLCVCATFYCELGFVRRESTRWRSPTGKPSMRKEMLPQRLPMRMMLRRWKALERTSTSWQPASRHQMWTCQH